MKRSLYRGDCLSILDDYVKLVFAEVDRWRALWSVLQTECG